MSFNDIKIQIANIKILFTSFSFDINKKLSIPKKKASFIGSPEENDILNYNWYIYNEPSNINIFVKFDNHKSINVIMCKINKNNNNDIEILIKPKNKFLEINIDPLIHPLGSLMLFYMMQQYNSLLIHASGVLDGDKGYLFTGVSGIGKSTMASIWENNGATIINDDRLVIEVGKQDAYIHNNPMPYYSQKPISGKLNAIFLLKQRPENYIKKLSGATAYSRLLGNFIQQLYDKEIAAKHLYIIEQLLKKIKVYEVGFKPDNDIVDLIRKNSLN